MRKQRIHKGRQGRALQLDTVGVRGSIPRGPTIQAHQIVEIPRGFSPFPAVIWRNGRARAFLVIAKDPKKKCDKSVTTRRRKSG